MSTKMSSWREQRKTVLKAPSITEVSVLAVNFIDTNPNYIYFANNSPLNLYVSVSPSASSSVFDMIVPPYATKLMAREEGLKSVYVGNEDTTTDAQISVVSFEAEFDPRNLPQTQEIVGASAQGLLGVIDINKMLSELPAGTKTIGKVMIDGSLPTGTNVLGKVLIDGSGANGASNHRKLSANTTNATNVKATGGRVNWGHVENLTAGTVYFKLYNKATAPTVGTDTPVFTLPIRANQTLKIDADLGLYFDLGIGYGITGGVADSDTTAVTANGVIVNLQYS